MTTPRSDRGCIRCVQPGVHFAVCESFGRADGECQGCAPEPAREEGGMLCDTCYRRLKGLLRDVPDLLGRMRSLTDPARAAVFDRIRVATSVTVASAPLDDDLADAIHVVETVLDVWLAYDRDLDWIANHEHAATWMVVNVLDEHPAQHGVREAWSVLDAMRQWGVERRDRSAAYVSPITEPDREIVSIPVREWFDPILEAKDAATRAGVSQRQLRTWVSDGILVATAQLRRPDGVVQKWFHASAVDKAAETMRERRHKGRPRGASVDTPEAVIVQE